jgi:hypothetical protein
MVTKEEATPHISRAWRPIFSRLPFEQAILLTKTA